MSESTQKLKILIIEDEELLRNALTKIFTRFGHEVHGVGDGIAMDAALAIFTPDIMVLDINLPGEDGVSITRRIRQTKSFGIIMLTGRGKMDEKLQGYECGADVYLVKPIDPLELHAAIMSLGRRLLPSKRSSWKYDISGSSLVTPRGIAVPLTGQQDIIIKQLTRQPGASVSRLELLKALGHPDDECSYQRLETLLSRFRTRVRGADPESELPVRARHNMAYAFLAEIDT